MTEAPDYQIFDAGDVALRPGAVFIVIPNLFGNGLSSYPSNTPWPDVGSR